MTAGSSPAMKDSAHPILTCPAVGSARCSISLTPCLKAIVDQWYGEVARIAAMPEIKDRLLTLGLEPVVNTPEEFGAQIKMETARWTKVIREAGIRAME
jgi:hypothetical protein